MGNIIWTLFVLDFDLTYGLEILKDDEEIGVAPVIYLVPLDDIAKVRELARGAFAKFHLTDVGDLCIGDIFEADMQKCEIPFKEVGRIDIPFVDRQRGYLDAMINMEVV